MSGGVVASVVAAIVVVMLSCKSPTQTGVVLLWDKNAPGCTPRRPVTAPTVPLEDGTVVGNEYRVSYIRPNDTLYATFISVGPNTYALCEWDTSDN